MFTSIIQMNGYETYDEMEKISEKTSGFYYVIFNIVMCMVTLNLFVGLMYSHYQEVADEQEVSLLVTLKNAFMFEYNRL